jgi:hypothetical protein
MRLIGSFIAKVHHGGSHICSRGKLDVCSAQLVTRGEIIPHLPTRAIPDLPLPLFDSVPQKSLPSPQSPSPPLPASPKPPPAPPPSILLLPRSLLFTRLKRRPDAIPSLAGKKSLACSDCRLAVDNRILTDISFLRYPSVPDDHTLPTGLPYPRYPQLMLLLVQKNNSWESSSIIRLDNIFFQ